MHRRGLAFLPWDWKPNFIFPQPSAVGESFLLWHCPINLLDAQLVEEKYSRKLLQCAGLSKNTHCWVAQLTFWISTVSLGTWPYSSHLWPSLMWLYTEIDSVQPIRLKKENTYRLTITWYQSVKWNLLYSGRGSHQNTFDNGLKGLAVGLQTRKQVADKIAKDQAAPKDPANIRPVWRQLYPILPSPQPPAFPYALRVDCPSVSLCSLLD